jgi:hypothetical protein
MGQQDGSGSTRKRIGSGSPAWVRQTAHRTLLAESPWHASRSLTGHDEESWRSDCAQYGALSIESLAQPQEESRMNHADMQFLDVEFPFAKKYGNFIGGQWVPPVKGEYFDNVSPITGEPFTSIPRSTEEDARHGRIRRRPLAPTS